MFIAIHGTFHVAGYTPDGDSIRFKARHPDNWAKLAGYPVKLNPQGHAQLRLEGIDTLEINFEGHHQSLKFANAALDFLLSQLGIRSVLWGSAHARDGTAGGILSGKVEKHQRPVALVFPGEPNWPDGAEVSLEAALLKNSINYKLLKAGLAYPTYYQGLPPPLREAFTQACRDARNNGRGLWPLDRTNLGVVVDGLRSLTERDVILPKLFRRLVRFIRGRYDLSRFQSYLKADPDPVTCLPGGRVTTLDALIRVQGNLVRLEAPPENLVFEEN
jgi:endonuclease YncB( thermonuclease family)